MLDTEAWDKALRAERDAIYFPEIASRNTEFAKSLHLAIWERVNFRAPSRNIQLKKLYYGIYIEISFTSQIVTYILQ